MPRRMQREFGRLSAEERAKGEAIVARLERNIVATEAYAREALGRIEYRVGDLQQQQGVLEKLSAIVSRGPR